MKHYILLLVLILAFTGNILSAQNNSSEMYVNTGDGLILRTAPSTSSQKIKTLPFASKVIVIAASENQVIIDNMSSSWFQVQHENDTGWVLGGYLAVIAGDDSGETIKYTNIYKLTFIDDNTLRFNDIDRTYIRSPISYDETGLRSYD